MITVDSITDAILQLENFETPVESQDSQGYVRVAQYDALSGYSGCHEHTYSCCLRLKGGAT